MAYRGDNRSGAVGLPKSVIKDGKKYVRKSRTVAVKPDDRLYGGTDIGDKYTTWKKGDGRLKPNLGEGRGAGIPYEAIQRRIKGKKQYYMDEVEGWEPPKPKKPKQGRPDHFRYRAKRGDTLSEIGEKFDVDWRDIWRYNLRNRSDRTRRILKRRGPDLFYRGSMFYIPVDDKRTDAIRRRLNY